MLGYRVKRWVVIFIEHPGMCVRCFTHTSSSQLTSEGIVIVPILQVGKLSRREDW